MQDEDGPNRIRVTEADARACPERAIRRPAGIVPDRALADALNAL